jgi:hypothetical protein
MALTPEATSEAHGSATKSGRLTPLWIVSLFVTLTETVLGVAATQTEGGVQIALTVFVLGFPVLVAAAFFLILWHKSWAFYSPGEYGNVDPARYVEALTQAQKRMERVTTQTADLKGTIVTVGNPDHFALLFKANGPSWRKSTKAMAAGQGCIIQVSTELLNADGTTSIAEALTFVPNVVIEKDKGGEGRHLRFLESGG